MAVSLRADRAVFRFSGPEAHKLLNDVVTGHIPDGETEVAAWWALLSAQGKILAEGLAGWTDGALWLDVHMSVADDFFRRMRMYKLRAEVTIEDFRESHRVGWTIDKEPVGIVHTDRYGPMDIGWRVVAPVAETLSWIQDKSVYDRTRIAAGFSQLGPDFLADTTFAHDVGMDLLDGIDFEKGCYVGQEVVSRMKHRGTARRRPVIVDGIEAPPGTAVVAGGREAGVIGDVIDGAAVAILRLDRLTDPSAATVGGRPVTLHLPVWATYTFGEATPED